jgi:hypothetical protein
MVVGVSRRKAELSVTALRFILLTPLHRRYCRLQYGGETHTHTYTHTHTHAYAHTHDHTVPAPYIIHMLGEKFL